MSEPGATTETLSATVPEDVEKATRALLERACDGGLTLATAESCTGGLVASLLTDIEGASHAFERGFIVYTKEAKSEMLGIPRDLIERHGAVSEPVARAMAEGAIARSNADIAVAVTGFAGPAGPDDEPGLVHLACARRGGATAHCVRHFGAVGRGAVRIDTLRVAIAMMTAALDR